MRKTARGGRTLHVFGALSRGGAETWFLQALARRGESPWSADVCLLAGREGECVPRVRSLGARVLYCPYRPAATFPARFLRLLRRERYDVVHGHVLLFSGAIAALADLAGVKLRVAHAHNSSDGKDGGPGRELYRATMRRSIARHANLVIACSRDAARALHAGDAAILHYGIELLPFTMPGAGSRERIGIPSHAKVIGAAGRLTRQKNYLFLLEAFAQAVRLRPELYLAVAGEGELRGEIESRVRELNLEGRVRLLGLRDDVPALLTGVCDGFVMPSLHEGLPVALLEAQAAGLPCLVSDVVSDEAVVSARQVEKLALAGPWPERLAALPSRVRVEPDIAVERVRRAGFDAAHSWSRLCDCYDAALSAAWSARAA